MASPINPDQAKSLTIKGRLSFPRFTHAEAVAANATSSFPKAADKVGPEFNLLIEQDQLDKIKTHIRDVFIPFVQQQNAAGEKRDTLDDKYLKKVLAKLDADDFEAVAPHLPLKEVSEKNRDSMPEAVANVKITGRPGSDIKLMAKVTDETQMAVPDPDILSFPVLKPLGETVFDMYAGAWVATTLNLFAFQQSASVNGISAGGAVAVYLGDLEGDRFGGGGASIDESAIFGLD